MPEDADFTSQPDPRAPADPEFCRRLLNALGQAVIATDAAGVVTYWNGRAEDLYGWTAAEAVGRPVAELTVAPVGQPSADEIMSELAAGGSWTGAFPVRRKNGRSFVALVTDTAVYDDCGGLEGVVGISSNFGQTLRPYLVQASEAAVVHDAHGVVLYASPAVTAVFGWDDEALVGHALTDFVHDDDAALLQQCITTALADDEPITATTEIRFCCDDGEYAWTDGRWTNLLADPNVRGLVVILRDTHERHLAMDRMTDLALNDQLTGLPNRSVLVDRLRHAVARRNPHGAALFLDLDDFKAINDSFGHAAGDRVLQAVAERLPQAVRPEDTCGRWAGDEFLVLVEELENEEAAKALVTRVREAIEQPLVLEDRTTVRPRVSIGLALLAEGRSADQVLRIADEQMYAVKRRRRRSKRSVVARPSSS